MKVAVLGFLLSVVAACAATPGNGPTERIGFDLGALDEEGLVGPPDGKRAVSYEFCVPDDPETLDEIVRIDPTAEAQTSPGRIGCGGGQRLVIGSTHQPDWRQVLVRLASRDDVERIEPAWFE